MSRSFSEFIQLCEASFDADLVRQGVSIKKGGEGGRIERERRQDPQQTRRMRAVGGGKLEPVVQKPRKDIGKTREQARTSARQEQPTQERGSADVRAKAAAAAKEERRKAALARRAAKSDNKPASETKPQSKDLEKKATELLTKKKEEPKKTESKPRRQWRTPEGHRMTRQERDQARNKEKTAAAQKTKKSANEILAQMRKEYEEKGGKWNSKVAVQMRAKAKAAAKASES